MLKVKTRILSHSIIDVDEFLPKASYGYKIHARVHQNNQEPWDGTTSEEASEEAYQF
jgi:hypothetical protein